MKYDRFLNHLSATEKEVSAYIDHQITSTQKIVPQILEDCSLSYIKQGGKKLRSSVLTLSCLAVGGDKNKALPACAAVEIFHTWTLVHDDIIDSDNTRRGVETVHKQAERYALEKLKLNAKAAAKYGIDTAIMTGDVQHGWAISILSNELVKQGIKPEIALHLISLLQIEVLRTLLEGQVLDIDYGLYYDLEKLTDDQIVDMLRRKTGILYEFCGAAGALIGRNSLVYDEEVDALKEFCSLCGTAFQIRDDILGLTGNASVLGKPIGSDVREGKKTLLVKEALANANESQRATLLGTLGNHLATSEQITGVIKLIVDLGGVQKADKIALALINQAIPHLDKLKDTPSKHLLFDWSSYLLDRDF